MSVFEYNVLWERDLTKDKLDKLQQCVHDLNEQYTQLDKHEARMPHPRFSVKEAVENGKTVYFVCLDFPELNMHCEEKVKEDETSNTI